MEWTIRRGAVCLGIAVFMGFVAHAQDPQFTQFYANPLYLNPAFAGTARCPRVVMNYRNQWPALTGTFVTTSASFDQHVDGMMGGLGLLVMHDQAGKGTLNTTTVSGIYSYQQAISRKFSLKVGFQATYFQKSLDWSKLTFDGVSSTRPRTYPAEVRWGTPTSAPVCSVTAMSSSWASQHITSPSRTNPSSWGPASFP